MFGLKKLVGVLVVLTGSAFAQSGSYGDAGDYLFELAPNAASFGKGGGSAADNGTGALYHNMAGMDYSVYRELDMGRRYLGDDFQMDHLAYVHPFDRFGTFGFSLYSMKAQNPVEQYSSFGQYLGTEDGGDLAVLFGWAKSWGPGFAFGSGLKVASQSFGDQTGTGFGFDMGMQGHIGKHFAWGMSLVNILGPSITLVKNPDDFASVLKIGTVTSFFENRLQILADWDKTNVFMGKDALGNTKEMDDRYRFGLDWKVSEWLAFRTGWNDREITLGTGLSTNWITLDYGFGYTRRDNTELGPGLSHMISLDFHFGKPPSAEKADLLKRLHELGEVQKLQVAQQLYLDSNFKASDAQLQVYLDENPTDSAALRLRDLLNSELSAWKTEQLSAEFRQRLDKRQYEDAQKLIDEMTTIDPHFDSLAIFQKDLLARQQINEKLEKLKGLNPEKDYTEIMNITGDILAGDSTHPLALDLRSQAEPYYKKAQSEAKYNEASRVYHEKNDLQQASNLLEESLAMDPKNEAANALYKEVSAKLKDFLMAQIASSAGSGDSVSSALLQKVRSLDMGERLLIASNLYADGDFEKADAEIKKILREAPEDAKALDLQEKIKVALVKREAENMYQEGLRLFNMGSSPEALDQLALALEKDSELEKARELRNQIVDKSVQQLQNRLKKYQESQNTDELKKAREEVNLLKSKAPDNEDLQKIDLKIETEEKVQEVLDLIGKGKLDEAELILNKTLEKDPDSSSANSAFLLLKEIRESME